MTSIAITGHGEARMSQRCICRSDLDTLIAHGTGISPDRFMLMKQDAARLIWGLKKQIATLERSTGKQAVVADGLLITVYHGQSRAGQSGERQDEENAVAIGNKWHGQNHGAGGRLGG